MSAGLEAPSYLAQADLQGRQRLPHAQTEVREGADELVFALACQGRHPRTSRASAALPTLKVDLRGCETLQKRSFWAVSRAFSRGFWIEAMLLDSLASAFWPPPNDSQPRAQ